MRNPKMDARRDWAETGSFTPERYEGDERKQYEEEAARILRQWDAQPEHMAWQP